MAQVSPHVEGPLNRLAAELGKRLRRPLRVEWDTSPQGDPCAWLAVSEAGASRRVASLTIRQKGPTTTYSVQRLNDQGPGHRSAALTTALRDLQAASVGTLIGPAPDTTPAPDIAPPSSATKPPTFTAAEAISHPAIRVAILAGHRVAEATGNQPEPATLIALVNAALPVVALVEEKYRPQGSHDDPDGALWTERVLVELLSGALKAAAPPL